VGSGHDINAYLLLLSAKLFSSLKKSLADSNKKHITIIQNEISPDKEKVATIELEKID